MTTECHFNNRPEHVCDKMFCKRCSVHFNHFIELLVRQNSDSLETIYRLSKKERMLRGYKAQYIVAIKFLINLAEKLRLTLGTYSVRIYTEDSLITSIFPITDYHMNSPIFQEFYEIIQRNSRKKITGLTFSQLEDFYNYCKLKDNLRSDIRYGGLYIDVDFIDYFEKTYNTALDVVYPRDEDREGLSIDGFLKVNNCFPYSNIPWFSNEGIQCDIMDEKLTIYNHSYNTTKLILMNYLDYLYCPSCTSRYSYAECIGEYLYCVSATMSMIFNVLGKGFCHDILHIPDFQRFRDTVSLKLSEMSSWPETPISHKWLGSQKYCEKLGVLPQILKNVGIPESDYVFRQNSCFNDRIAGHPMASRGWFWESLEEVKDALVE